MWLSKCLLSGGLCALLAWSFFGPRSEPVKPWTFEVTTPMNQCISEFQYQWPGLGQISRLGEGARQKCKGQFSFTGTNLAVPGEPLNIQWRDGQGVRHAVSFPVKELLGNRTVYGGSLIVELTGSQVNLYVKTKHKSADGTSWHRSTALLDSKK
jgi:hypothetical protein